MRPLTTPTTTQASRLSIFATRESVLRLALSFVLAVALWLYVTGKQDPTISTALPQPIGVGAANLPTNLTVTNQLKKIHLRYRTSHADMQVTSTNFHAFVDLLNFGPGVYHRVPVHVQSDPGIQIVTWSPHAVDVSIDARQQRNIPVTWTITSQVPAGYNSTVTVSPRFVDVSGPRTVVSQVKAANIDLNLRGITSSLNEPYKVTLLDGQGSPVSIGTRLTVEPQLVQVQVGVRALSSYKALPIIPTLRGQPRSGFGVVSVSIDPPQVTVQGSPARLRKLSALYTAPIWEKQRGSTFTQKVRLILPPGVHSPVSTVKVHTAIQPLSGSSSTEVGVRLGHVAAGLTAHTRPTRVFVTVVGPASRVRSVGGQIQAIVDAAGLGVGTYSVPPRIAVPKGFKVVNIYPSTVSVQLVNQLG